jgi:hypothetical protein
VHEAVAYIAYMKDDRRSAPRVAVNVPVHQHIEGQKFACTVSSLSLSGLYMERPLGSFVRHSAEIELEIPLPDGAEPLWARAEIVYDCFGAQFHGTAVRFKQMSARDRGRLFALVTRVARSAHTSEHDGLHDAAHEDVLTNHHEKLAAAVS